MSNARTDYSFVVLKLLLHRWLTRGEPVTSEWLARTAGVLTPLSHGRCDPSAVCWNVAPIVVWFCAGFPRKNLPVCSPWPTVRVPPFALPINRASRVLLNHNFAVWKNSIRPASPSAACSVQNIIISELDLVGTPRLDLSLHCPGRRMNLDFIEKLDPALKRVQDPLAPANLVVHAMRHADAQFIPRDGGLGLGRPGGMSVSTCTKPGLKCRPRNSSKPCNASGQPKHETRSKGSLTEESAGASRRRNSARRASEHRHHWQSGGGLLALSRQRIIWGSHQ